jgi:phosphosulfolactate phosphohydrolase-like enzyme
MQGPFFRTGCLVRARVRIDAFPESAFRYLDWGIVCIDVIDSCTAAVTSAARGTRVFPANDMREALQLMDRLPGALLAGEGGGTPSVRLRGSVPVPGEASDQRHVVLLDPPGTRLMSNCRGGKEVYVACFRNVAATVRFLAERGRDVALLGGDFRCEDRMVAARIGRGLVASGFVPEGPGTADVIERWGSADVSLIGCGRSANELRRSGRHDDIEFIMQHVDDLDLVCRYDAGEGVTGVHRAGDSETKLLRGVI